MAGIHNGDSLDRTEPLDAFQLEQDFNHQTANVRELGISLYRECWDEFYRWEPGECQQLIADLPPNSSDAGDFEELTDVLASRVFREQSLGMDVDSSISEKIVTVTVYDRGRLSSQAQMMVEEVKVVATILAHPTYESCPPTSKNIARRLDGLNEHIQTPFIPYADEQGFNVAEYVLECESFAWQVDWEDPDLDVIQLETARRLHFGRGLSFAEIDGLSLLRQLRLSNESGLLWDTSQRDVLMWPGAYNPQLPTFTSTIEDDQNGGEYRARLKNDLQARLSALLETFCPNLNCVQAACPMHTGTDIYPEIPNMHRSTRYDPIRPTVTNKDMRYSKGTPCGAECFRNVTDEFEEQVYWGDPVDLATLKTILDILPDLYPCELAVLCRKPCREVHVQRKVIFEDDKIYDFQMEEISIKSRASQRKPKYMKDEAEMSFTPFPPCYHKGPCAAKFGCSCFQQKHHCQRNCRCSSECALRWKGCKCQKKDKPCGSNCKCVKAHRECDVDLCKPCHARRGSRDGCRNVKIQQGISKRMEIKRGAFGLGAFAATAISPNDYLGEYVGELFTTDNTPNVTAANYKDLNYNFTVNETWVIDAGKAGNNTRYPNHAMPKFNCEARIRLVNGEHRIGFFATKRIAIGEEILLDYGEAYWAGRTPG